MTIPRLRIRSFMILVLVLALWLGGVAALSKLNRNQINELKPWVVVLGAFILMVTSKLALLIRMRARRDQPKPLLDVDSSPATGNESPSL